MNQLNQQKHYEVKIITSTLSISPWQAASRRFFSNSAIAADHVTDGCLYSAHVTHSCLNSNHVTDRCLYSDHDCNYWFQL